MCGPEELVGRAEQEVAAERLHVDGPVQGVVHGVDDRDRADLAGARRGARHVADRAHRVGGVVERDHLGAPGLDHALEGVPVQGAGRGVDRHLAHEDTALGEVEPRSAVGLVVDLGDEDLVTGLQFASDGLGEEEVQGRHVGPEGDLVGAAAEEVAQRLAGAGDHGVGLLGRREEAVDVAVARRRGTRAWRPGPAAGPGCRRDRRGRRPGDRRWSGRGPETGCGRRRCRSGTCFLLGRTAASVVYSGRRKAPCGEARVQTKPVWGTIAP